MQVGATYALSKRTTAYAYTGNWQNDMATTATAARKGKQAIFGLAHSF
jgi:predicted porin